MVFFSVLSFFALAFTVLFLVIWVIKAILKKKTKMWLAAIVSLVIAISSFIAFGAIHDSKQTDPSSPSEQVSATSFTAQSEEESTTTTQPPTTEPTTAETTTEPESASLEPDEAEPKKDDRSVPLFLLFLAALLSTLVCAVIWLVKLYSKEDRKRVSIAAIVSGFIMIAMFWAMIGSFDGGNEEEEQPASASSTSIPASTGSTTEATTTTQPTTTTTEATTTTKPQKKLSSFRFKSAEILDDDGSYLGDRGYVKMKWEVFDNASDREIHDFLERAYFNRYDYINIFFDNGTTLWSWGFADMFQIGDTPDQGYGAVKYDADNLDGIRGRYIWIGTHYDYS